MTLMPALSPKVGFTFSGANVAWIESHQTLAKHPKLLRLARELGISRVQAVGHLHFLWWWAADYAQEGVVSCFDAEEIAEAAEWKGDANRFVSALLNGWIDEKDGKLVLHDWHDYFGKLLDRRRRNANAMRVSRTREQHVSNTSDTRVKLPNHTQPYPTKSIADAPILPDGAFEEIWSKYPEKSGKKQAEKHFKASVKSEADLSDIRKALANYLRSERVGRGFLQNGSTWFNNWRDWITPTPAMMGGGKADSPPDPVRRLKRCRDCGHEWNPQERGSLCPVCYREKAGPVPGVVGQLAKTIGAG